MVKHLLLLTTVMAASGVACANAYSYQGRHAVTNEAAVSRLSCEKLEVFDNPKVKASVIRKATVSSDDAPTFYTLSCKFTPTLDEKYVPLYAVAVKEDGDVYDNFFEEYDFTTVEVPEGTYDIFGLFVNADMGLETYYSPSWAVVAREGVKVGSDTEITLSGDEAVNRVTIRQQLPDGGDLLLPEILGFDDNGDPEWNMEEGSYNVTQINVENYIIRKDGANFNLSASAGYRLWNGETSEGTCDILFSPLSDNWLFAQERIPLGCFQAPHYIVASASMDASSDIMLLADNFFNYNPSFMHTPVGKDISDDVKGSGFIYSFLYNGQEIKQQFTLSTMNGAEYEFPSRYVYISPDNDISPYLTPFLRDAYIDVYGAEMECMMAGAPIVKNGDKMQISIAGSEFSNMDSFDIRLFTTQEDGSEASLAPGHPLFSYTMEEVETMYGNSAPVAIIASYDLAEEMELDNCKWVGPLLYYVGRQGENRFSDSELMEYEIVFDGETIMKDFNYSYMLYNYMTWLQDYSLAGEMKMTFTNNNVEVDGIQGMNKTEIGFNSTRDDAFPPTVKFLQFRSKDGKLTDRFATAADGVINIAAADYQVHTTPWYSWCEPLDVEIEVEYAPYGTENYLPLEVNEMPDMFGGTGLGYIFTGSLDAVDSKSDNGWFDIRIKTSDIEGNFQTQTISPAFKIETLTGVANVPTEEDSVKVVGNSIIIPADGAVFSTQGVRVSPANLPSGIYLVKTPRTSRKVVVR